MPRGKIVILSGPSGSGKTTLYKLALKDEKFQGILAKSVSMTTRAPRPGERPGRDYFFISEAMFFHKRKAGHFLESEKVFRNYYGTPRKEVRKILRQGKNVLLSIDVKGAKAVWEKNRDCLKIFVRAPSLKVLKQRLNLRATEARQDLDVRFKTAKKELKEARNYDYVIVNDSLPRAYAELKAILMKELLCGKGRKPGTGKSDF